MKVSRIDGIVVVNISVCIGCSDLNIFPYSVVNNRNLVVKHLRDVNVDGEVNIYVYFYSIGFGIDNIRKNYRIVGRIKVRIQHTNLKDDGYQYGNHISVLDDNYYVVVNVVRVVVPYVIN